MGHPREPLLGSPAATTSGWCRSSTRPRRTSTSRSAATTETTTDSVAPRAAGSSARSFQPDPRTPPPALAEHVASCTRRGSTGAAPSPGRDASSPTRTTSRACRASGTSTRAPASTSPRTSAADGRLRRPAARAALPRQAQAPLRRRRLAVRPRVREPALPLHAQRQRRPQHRLLEPGRERLFTPDNVGLRSTGASIVLRGRLHGQRVPLSQFGAAGFGQFGPERRRALPPHGRRARGAFEQSITPLRSARAPATARRAPLRPCCPAARRSPRWRTTSSCASSTALGRATAGPRGRAAFVCQATRADAPSPAPGPSTASSSTTSTRASSTWSMTEVIAPPPPRRRRRAVDRLIARARGSTSTPTPRSDTLSPELELRSSSTAEQRASSQHERLPDPERASSGPARRERRRRL